MFISVYMRVCVCELALCWVLVIILMGVEGTGTGEEFVCFRGNDEPFISNPVAGSM